MGKKIAYLANLRYSPDINPLAEPQEVRVRKRFVRTGTSQDLVDPRTGEVRGVVIGVYEEKEEQEFVKVFSEGVRAAFDLSKTAYRVFQLVLAAYEKTEMRGGFVDAVHLAWFDGGLSGQAVGMSEYTFKRGMKELLSKSFIAPREPNLYWVNPALFFKGDRVAFLKEYRRKKANSTKNIEDHEQDEKQNSLELGAPT